MLINTRLKKLIYSLLLFTTLAQAQNKVVYGVDNRVDPTPDNPFYELSRSSAALIGEFMLKRHGDIYEIADIVTLQDGMMLCADEKFKNQLMMANCSGSLIAPDLILTAGHCVEDDKCSGSVWVFDYNLDTTDNLQMNAANVYHCQKIVKRELNMDNGNDYAVVQLDRPVLDRAPLKFRRSGKIATGTPLVVIGHPTGLPTKISAGATVKLNDDPIYFTANLDTFGGNSGSAVFNAQTLEIEGILVRGATDYIWDEQNSCQRVNYCSAIDRSGDDEDYSCFGEDVTRITNVGLDSILSTK